MADMVGWVVMGTGFSSSSWNQEHVYTHAPSEPACLSTKPPEEVMVVLGMLQAQQSSYKGLEILAH